MSPILSPHLDFWKTLEAIHKHNVVIFKWRVKNHHHLTFKANVPQFFCLYASQCNSDKTITMLRVPHRKFATVVTNKKVHLLFCHLKKEIWVYVFNNSLLRCCILFFVTSSKKHIAIEYRAQDIKDMPIWVWKRYSKMIYSVLW